MSDEHLLPLLTRDMPWPAARASVFKDPNSGLWCWMHYCAHRLPVMPFYGHPKQSWGEAFQWASAHMEYCS